MKNIHIRFSQLPWMLCALLLTLPSLGNAEIYKWKDKNGTTRYSDTPPPSNIKQKTIGGKKAAKPAGEAPSATPASAPAIKDTEKDSPPVPGSAEEEAAAKRQNTAEAEKKNKQEQEAEANRKAENCKVAKARYETYKQGGRVYKINEKGEREYMGDKDLQDGKAQAQKEMDENCT